MLNFYSQHGEDVILYEIFKEQKQGFFVEVGCIDGRRFSNTLTFEKQGWNGMCIEAHLDYIKLLKKNRPNSIICHCAAGETDEEDVSFFANARGSLSTLDKSKESDFKKKYNQYFTGFEEQHVKKRTLNSLFRENGINHIDFISLDVEGYETEVLKGINLKEYNPYVFVIESDSKEHENELDKILLTNGYHKSIRLAQNIFYLNNPILAKRIVNKKFDVQLTHTKHPLDSDGDIKTSVHIDTRTNILKSFLSKLTKMGK